MDIKLNLSYAYASIIDLGLVYSQKYTTNELMICTFVRVEIYLTVAAGPSHLLS